MNKTLQNYHLYREERGEGILSTTTTTTTTCVLEADCFCNYSKLSTFATS